MLNRRPQPLAMFIAVMMFAVGFVATAGAGTIIASGQNRGLYDNNDDELGNAQQTPAGSLAIGERNSSTQPTNDELRYWLPFELTLSDRAEIATSSQVLLSINLVDKQNVAGYAIDIWYYTGRTSAVAVNADYQNADGILINDAITETTPDGLVTWDVTSFVKSEAALAGSVIVFNLQMDPADLPDENTTKNNYIINTVGAAAGLEPTLSIIPEPATFALLGLGTLMLFRRRRMLRHAPALAAIALMMTIGFNDAAQAATVVAASDAGRVIDGAGGFSAEFVAVGEPGSNNEDNEGRFIVFFTPDAAERIQIAAASEITLDIRLDRTGDNSADLAGFAVDLYGFEDVEFTGINATQYHQAATLVQADAFTAADGGQVDLDRSFDVTAFAKAEAARSATSTIAFRLQVNPDTLPIVDGKQVFWALEGIDFANGGSVPVEPTLSVIPEPASAAMFGLGALALMRRRRSH